MHWNCIVAIGKTCEVQSPVVSVNKRCIAFYCTYRKFC